MGSARCHALFPRLREQWHSVSDTPGQGIGRTQRPRHPGDIGRDVRVSTDVHGPFEQGECSGHIPLVEAQQTEPVIGVREGVGVRERLGKLQSCFPQGLPATNVRSSAWHKTSKARANSAGGEVRPKRA